LTHSTRQGLDALIGAVKKPNTIEGCTCPRTAFARFNVSRPGRIFHRPPDTEVRREGKSLGQESDQTTDGVDVIADIDTIHPKVAGLRFTECREDTEKCRLSGPIRTEQPPQTRAKLTGNINQATPMAVTV
jgi:hypothetical protein